MSNPADPSPADRPSAVASVRAELEQALDRLDRLGYSLAGCYLAMTIDRLPAEPSPGLLRDIGSDTPYEP